MRKIAVISVARSDYGILRPLLRLLEQADDIQLQLIVAAGHFPPEFGSTWREIEADGIPIAAEVDCTLAADRPGSIVRSMALATLGVSQALERLRPDFAVVLGDRAEMHAAAVAAVPFLIPLVHIAGGTLSLGAIDDSFRHSITKLAHVHFAETQCCADRIVQMGEEPWRVHVTGALGLDNACGLPVLSLEEINRRFGLDIAAPPVLVTLHPETREAGAAARHIDALLDGLQQGLESSDVPIVFTAPNADAEGRIIIGAIERFVKDRPAAWFVRHLGTEAYFSLMRQARLMVGNSSSGLVEAASFKLPVVNVGGRQDGRLAPPNVVSVPAAASAIAAAVRQTTSLQFKSALKSLDNPYGDGTAAPRMLDLLRTLPAGPDLVRKHFHRVMGAGSPS
ncbi:UDP-N-acetylglucosamine 2-epimerase [Azospirillum palustre]